MKLLNVGISILAIDKSQHWASGVNQNVAFLAQALRQNPRIGEIYFLDGGCANRLPQGTHGGWPEVPVVVPHDVTYQLDIVVEMGAPLPLEWMRHVRALGAKIVKYAVTNTYADLGESPMFGRVDGPLFNGAPWHEVWTSQHHMKSSGPLLRTISRVPVRAMPDLWSSVFLDARISQLCAQGFSFGFEPRPGTSVRAGWRVGIFEPNISVVRNSTIPMLVCEQAYRTNHDAIGLMLVMNTFHMKEHLTFNRFASHLDLTKNSRATYEPRMEFAECMARNRVDAVVSHQWEGGVDNLYYDALHGGYPLIHNSPSLQQAGAGFYFPDFEAASGAALLLDAWARDPDFWSDYRQSGEKLLAAVSPRHPANVRMIAERIGSLVDGGELS